MDSRFGWSADIRRIDPPSPQSQNRFMLEALIPDLQVVRRSRAIAADYCRSRLQIIADRPGNPRGAQVRQFGTAFALRAPAFGPHVFNRAYGFSDDQIEEASEAVAWYADGAVPGSFEITPGLSTTKLVRLLQEYGYRQSGFHATFAALLNLPTAASDEVEVRRVEGRDDLRAFADAYHLGWNLNEFRISMEAWPNAPGWSLYIGLVGGRTAGAAILYLRGDDAYLADSAVSPQFRRHGVHRALLNRRCLEAANYGALTVFSGAEFLSGSHRNMIRQGLSLLYTETVWTKD
jgi:GNAT superfamily N-acetyltransferase